MINVNPLAYRLVCSSCGGLSTLPLDVLQTKIISNQDVEFKVKEFKWLILAPFIFSLQNTVYNWAKFIPNQSIRGILAGLSASPPYILLEMNKIRMRLNLLPNYKLFALIMTIREILVYVTIYNIIVLNIPYSKFIAALLANSIGFPLRLYALKKSYSTLNINFEILKKTALLEIIKSAMGDTITLLLLYKFPLSPFKL